MVIFTKLLFRLQQREQTLLFCKGIAQRGKSGSSSHSRETGGWEVRRQPRRPSKAASPWAKTARHVPPPEFQQADALSNSRCLCSCRALPLSTPAPAAAPPAGHRQGTGSSSPRAPSPAHGGGVPSSLHRGPQGQRLWPQNPLPPFRCQKGSRSRRCLPPLPLPLQSKHVGGGPGAPVARETSHTHTPPAAQEEPTLGTAPLCAPPNPSRTFPGFGGGWSLPSPSPGQDRGSRRPLTQPAPAPWHPEHRMTPLAPQAVGGRQEGQEGTVCLRRGTEESRQGRSHLSAFGSRAVGETGSFPSPAGVLGRRQPRRFLGLLVSTQRQRRLSKSRKASSCSPHSWF